MEVLILKKFNVFLLILLVLCICIMIIIIFRNGNFNVYSNKLNVSDTEHLQNSYEIKDLYGNESLFFTKQKAILCYGLTTCDGCRQELEQINKLLEKTNSKFPVYFISNQDKYVIQKFLENNHYTKINTLCDYKRELYKAFNIYAFPTTIFLNENGIVIRKTNGWDQKNTKYMIDFLFDLNKEDME